MATSELVNHTYNVINQINAVQASVAESESALKIYLVRQDLKSKIDLLRIHRLLSERTKTLEQLTKNPGQHKNAVLLTRRAAEKINFENNILSIPATKLTNSSADSQKERIVNKLVNETLNILTQEENRLLKERVAENERSRQKSFYITLATGLLAFCFMGIVLLGMNRENKKRIIAEEEAKKNELKYRKLVEDASVVMYTANLEGKFTYASNKCFSLTGFTHNEITGMHFTALIDKSMVKEVADNYENQFLKNIETTTIEFPIITKQGYLKWVEQVATLVYEQEVAIGFQCIVKDITDKKATEDELRRKEYEVETVLNNTREGFFVIDTNYEIQILNKQAKRQIEQISGNEAAVGMNFLAVVSEADKEQAKENFELVFKGESVYFEFLHNTSEGAVWSQVSHSPIRNKEGTITGAAVITHDITEVKIAQEQIVAANEKIAAMVASTGDAFFILRKDYTVSMINDAGKKLARLITGKGVSCDDNLLLFISSERKAAFITTIRKVLAGSIEEAEEKLLTSEGEIWIQNSYFPVYNATNKIIGACISSKNITARKEAEKKIQQSWAEKEEYRLRLQSILDNTPLSVFIKDMAGRYLLVNKSFRDVVKLTDEKIIGKTDFDFIDKAQAERYKKTDDLVVKTLQPVETEETLFTKSGEQHLLIVKFPLFDKDQRLYGIGGIASDITERNAYQQQILEEKKKAERAEQLQEQFLANMSHEIRTPMNGIIGMTNLLMNTDLNEEQKEFTHLISQSSDNLLVLLNDILDLSKIKAGKLTVEAISFSLISTIDAIINSFRVKAKEKKLDLIIQYGASIPSTVSGDPYRLAQVLSNLLSNAIKFTLEGFIKIYVDKLRQQHNTVTLKFSVADSGIGINKENQELIFNSFQQAGADTARKFGGTGLGLAITKQLVELQNGKINVYSNENNGTTFTVELTYAVNDNPVKKETNDACNITIANDMLSGKKVLITEDNHINQKVLFNLLKKWNMRASIARNGKEALEILQKDSHFDFILMDLRMPEMDGFQTTAFIRSKLLLNTPIIAMTASTMRSEKEKCLSIGMNEYIAKPFSFAQLHDTMQRLLVKSHDKEQHDNDISLVSKSGADKYYSLSYLHEMDDNEYCCEILEMFLKDTQEMLEEIKHAVFCEHWNHVYSKTHKLKSSLGLLQMHQLLEFIGRAELKAFEKRGLATIKTDIEKATELFRIIRPMLESDLSMLKALPI